ncbi:UNVERIFIED_ORG: hypothetical protein J2Y81_007742 [Paraburkholderia sediminicola]|nr:hypothetical protein [Paraburkholderia sediminicola]
MIINSCRESQPLQVFRIDRFIAFYDKGSYRIAPLDLAHPEKPSAHLRELPDCVGILSPDYPANEQRLDTQVEWFAQSPAGDMLVACLLSHWQRPSQPDLFSFSAITDEPPPEIAAAGHDRCIIPIKPEHTRVTTESENAARRVLVSSIAKLRWCFWHGKPKQAVERMKGILIICRLIIAETPGVAESLAQLDYRARELVAYVEANGGSTINHGARHRQHKPVSTATAESALNEVIIQRMCKRQQMRWSPQGVHLLAQLRCALINGGLVERLARYK